MVARSTVSIVGVVAVCFGVVAAGASLAGGLFGFGGTVGGAPAGTGGDNPPDSPNHGGGEFSDEEIFESTLVGLPADMTGEAGTIRGVPAGGVPWVVAEGDVEIESDGDLKADIKGLLITGTGTDLDGTTGVVTGVRASLTCEGQDTVATTDVARLSSDGDAEIDEEISLPMSCLAPIVLIRVGSTQENPGPLMGPWIAATGFGAKEEVEEELDLEAVPFEFDPEDLDIVFADWVEGIGLPDDDVADRDGWSEWGDWRERGEEENESLLLSKNGATAASASAGAVIEGVDGIILTELGFDVRSGGHCGAGAPRFNVVVDIEGSRSLFFFGCSAGDVFPVPGVTPEEGWKRIRFTDEDAMPADGLSVWPGFGEAKVVEIEVVFDEGTDAGPDFSGLVILDNIDVNGALIGSSGDRRDW